MAKKNVLIGCLPTNGSNGDFQNYNNAEVIFQSIYVILNTIPGTRIWQPDFGCDLMKYVWDLNDDATINNITTSIKQALERWEPRITVTSVDAIVEDAYNHKVNISITFTYKDSSYHQDLSINGAMMDLTVYDI